MIPFSVALEDRLSKMSEEEAAEELKKLGTKSALPRIAVSGEIPRPLSLDSWDSSGIRFGSRMGC